MAQDGAHLTKRLERRVGDFLDEHGLAEAGSPIVAGVSGGPDSVCLLHLLARLRARLPLDLRAAHLHHGLRGAEADDDAAYVAELCKRLDVPLATERIAVKKQRGRSLEEAAREARYAFFRRVATAARAHVLALGHTADDQAETILLNMLRGAGLAGLRGMRALARRNDGGVDLVIARPLLATRRQETEAYCREHGLEAREDSSNRSPEFTRNRVRQELVPLLESFNPKVQEALLRTGAQAEAGLDFLDAAARKAWPELVGVAEGRVTFDRARLNALHPALQAALMRRALLEARGTLQGIEEAHVAAMLALARGPSGKAVDLPDGLVLRAEYDALVLGPAGLGEAPAKLDGSCPWPFRARPRSRDGGFSAGSSTLIRKRRCPQAKLLSWTKPSPNEAS